VGEAPKKSYSQVQRDVSVRSRACLTCQRWSLLDRIQKVKALATGRTGQRRPSLARGGYGSEGWRSNPSERADVVLVWHFPSLASSIGLWGHPVGRGVCSLWPIGL